MCSHEKHLGPVIPIGGGKQFERLGLGLGNIVYEIVF